MCKWKFASVFLTCWKELVGRNYLRGRSSQRAFTSPINWRKRSGVARSGMTKGTIDTVNTVALKVDQWFNLKISVWIPYNPMSSPTRPKKPWRSTSFWWFQRIFPTVRGSVLNHLTKFKREQRVSVIHIFHLLNLALVKWFLLCSLDVSLKPDF